LEQAKIAGRNGEAKEVAEALRKAAPPQILVRCQFCGTSISPAAQKGLGALDTRNVVGPVGVKARSFIHFLSVSIRADRFPLSIVHHLPVVQQATPGLLHLPPPPFRPLFRLSFLSSFFLC
jgi:hypothetical protein